MYVDNVVGDTEILSNWYGIRFVVYSTIWLLYGAIKAQNGRGELMKSLIMTS